MVKQAELLWLGLEARPHALEPAFKAAVRFILGRRRSLLRRKIAVECRLIVLICLRVGRPGCL